MKDDVVLWVLGLFLIGLLALFVASLVVSYGEFSKLYDAQTPQEINRICHDDWYSNTNLQNLPAKCSTIYKTSYADYFTDTTKNATSAMKAGKVSKSYDK